MACRQLQVRYHGNMSNKPMQKRGKKTHVFSRRTQGVSAWRHVWGLAFCCYYDDCDMYPDENKDDNDEDLAFNKHFNMVIHPEMWYRLCDTRRQGYNKRHS